MKQTQRVSLYPIQSVIPFVKEEFDLMVSESSLLELSIVPIRDIGNYYTRSFVQCGKIPEGGKIPIPAKTFHIESVLAREYQGTQANPDRYLNNPYPIIEYVNYNALVDYENITDEFGQIIGHIKGGKYYDKFWQPLADTKRITHIEQCHQTHGRLYRFPIAYQVEGEYLVFTPPYQKEIEIKATLAQTDPSGWPLIDEPSKIAIAYYMQLVNTRIRYYNQQVSKDMYLTARDEYQERKRAARNADLIMNENLAQKILQILSSFNQTGVSPSYFS